ncbi:MAG: hypothetical protein AVDCRST_MAG23-907 [uncultured Sphingosinicella sp.]|uniref:Uncharacterized protein n=1 Tax=uncultured Sphingosinicella sp. TaxID=478748 RepID=A0A6J4TRX8_9SPHN|nr:ATP-grasp fold amidoligase family protein [uncultured Sphingosinicella sp.]CAA9529185.1 MAG: hypothetical protein AVDCRST_MAG23-907 [uncultured Sphingosinicella sp.]
MASSARTVALPLAEPRRVPLKLSLMHWWRNGHFPDLAQPTRFNELVQARKLHDRDPRLPQLADKVAVKEHVARRLGAEWVIPTLWHGTELPKAPEWPLPFVLKSSHGCCQCAFVRTGEEDWPAIRRRAEGWLKQRYGAILDEWLYSELKPGLLVEPFIGDEGALPVDYKFFVFGGRVEFIQVDTDREHDHKRVIFDRRWRALPCELQFRVERREVPRPAALQRMIEAAETLGRGFEFVRVDLYEIGERPMFGELSFYPGSGLDRFRPAHFDALFGEHWLRARALSPDW